jgi:hypothetical protein
MSDNTILGIRNMNMKQQGKISGSHGDKYEDGFLL